MTLRLINSLILMLIGTKLGVEACGCGCCGCGCCGCCQPCCNCFPCTNPPLLIKLPPTPPKLCCCCCRPCCCGCCGKRKRRSIALEKKCLKSIKKQTVVCSNATRNCKRCANLIDQKIPKLNAIVVPKIKTESESRARRQVEKLGQILGMPSNPDFSLNKGQLKRYECKC